VAHPAPWRSGYAAACKAAYTSSILVGAFEITSEKGAAMATRNGSAEWRGDLQSGSGELEVGDGVFKGAYSFSSRFEEGEGTNPEELIGAAHAGCYSMALSADLGRAGHTTESVATEAEVSLEMIDPPTITRIVLHTRARVPGIDREEFDTLAEQAKRNCPVSRALGGVEIVLDARLEG
jgi:lipoyl-dependent peroxiredoxin